MRKYINLVLSIVLITSLFSTTVVSAVDVLSFINDEDDKEKIEEIIQYVYGNIQEEENELGVVYETYKKNYDTRSVQPYSIISDEFSDDMEDENFKKSYEASFDTKYLEKFSDDQYEIALAKANGTYLYLGSSDSYEESVQVAQKAEEVIINSNNIGNDEYIPCVIDNYGLVTYSTNSMARAIKYTNGAIDNSTVTYLYDSSSKVGTSNSDNYINHNYIEDAPIIEETSNSVKVMINGYIGWGKKNNDGTSDFSVIPMNQVYNPSYYTVSNNQLYHYVSNDITDTSKTNGNKFSVGIAPSYLNPGTTYYSYDCKYFYTSLSTLTSDLKQNTTKNAINNGNPYYNYYQYLPFRSKTSYTAAQLDQFINNNTNASSKLRGIGSTLISVQNKYGVNAAMILGVAINESGWGTSTIAQQKNNIFGLNAVDTNPGQAANTYSSVADCIEQFAKYYISKGYADPQDWRCFGGFLGNKEVGVNVKYASDPFWGEKNTSHFFSIDRSLSGFNSGYDVNKLLEYNKYTLGIVNSDTTVKFSNGSTIYNIKDKSASRADVVNGSIILKSKTPVNIGGISSYKVVPARTSALTNNNEFEGTFDWNIDGYISTSCVNVINDSNISTKNVIYQSHVANYGWQDWVGDGATSGTSGESKQLEGIKIKVQNLPYSGGITYKTHVQTYGWQDWVSDGELSGTTGESKRVEAVKIKLTGEISNNYDVYYRVHAQSYGWLDWAKNGEAAGTEGLEKRIEAIEIVLVNKGGSAPGSTARPFIESTKMADVTYRTHVQNQGWQSWVKNGATSGTTNNSLRLEGINIKLQNNVGEGKITYRTHVQNIGWQNWVSGGELSGTEGKSLRLEAIQIKLTDDLANKYDIYYRVHAETYGWLDWAKNGESAGTEGLSKRLEAIEIKIVKKGDSAPGSTINPFYKKPDVTYKTHLQSYGDQNWVSNGVTSGSVGQSKRLESINIKLENAVQAGNITYRTHVQNDGWQSWVENGALSGTIGQSKRLEAIEIKLTDKIAEMCDVYYRVHAETYGWLGWAKNGESAGTEGLSKILEAIEIKIVPKGEAAPGSTKDPFVTKKPLVVIDAGHNYGGDEGAIATLNGVTYYERDINMKVAIYLKEYLEEKGYRIKMTREATDRDTSNLNKSLSDRYNLANNSNADLFISIHHNSATSVTARGTEVYYCNDGTSRVAKSKALATKAVNNIANNTGFINRGAKDNSFVVLKNTKMPAILVEGGFMSNQEELSLLLTDSIQRKIAKSIADAVVSEF